ncbi:hypothetical protein [Alteribacillus bidgolensis]|nr:hypothetical protein [Alteribacillus bidgolensis]
MDVKRLHRFYSFKEEKALALNQRFLLFAESRKTSKKAVLLRF